jgi:hypothetical protein
MKYIPRHRKTIHWVDGSLMTALESLKMELVSQKDAALGPSAYSSVNNKMIATPVLKALTVDLPIITLWVAVV